VSEAAFKQLLFKGLTFEISVISFQIDFVKAQSFRKKICLSYRLKSIRYKKIPLLETSLPLFLLGIHTSSCFGLKHMLLPHMSDAARQVTFFPLQPH